MTNLTERGQVAGHNSQQAAEQLKWFTQPLFTGPHTGHAYN